MKVIRSREFGEIMVAEEDIIRFVKPIYGFEELRDFVLITDDEVGAQFAWLQSVEEENICFILVNPYVVRPNYNMTLPADVVSTLMCTEVVPWAIAIVTTDFAQSTANLKSPILINPTRKIAMQAILEDDYPIKQRILGEERGA